MIFYFSKEQVFSTQNVPRIICVIRLSKGYDVGDIQ